MRYILICLIALLTIGANAQGKGHWKHHGKGHKHWKQSHNLPPGIAKKTSLPPGISKHFATTYPGATKVVWTQPKGKYRAKYLSNGYWTTTTYTPQATVVETRTFIPVAKAPQPVIIYKEANPSITIADIIRLELPGKETLYKVRTAPGRYVYVNETGTKVIL